jgi:hypothetical protein
MSAITTIPPTRSFTPFTDVESTSAPDAAAEPVARPSETETSASSSLERFVPNGGLYPAAEALKQTAADNNPAPQGAGGSAGRPQMHDIRFTKLLDTSTTQIY